MSISSISKIFPLKVKHTWAETLLWHSFLALFYSGHWRSWESKCREQVLHTGYTSEYLVPIKIYKPGMKVWPPRKQALNSEATSVGPGPGQRSLQKQVSASEPATSAGADPSQWPLWEESRVSYLSGRRSKSASSTGSSPSQQPLWEQAQANIKSVSSVSQASNLLQSSTGLTT